MARPPKKGLDYFPLYCDFYHNRKIRRILKACGPSSGTVLTCLLGNIYNKDGYYIQWDDDLPFDIADIVGMSEGSVQEIINMALKAKFFNEDLFQKYKILTSVGIQENYLDILNQLRRSKSHIQKDFWLLENDVDNSKEQSPPKIPEKPQTPNNFVKNGINAEETPINTEETLAKPTFMQQTKLKEIKGKEIKEANAEKDSRSITKFVEGFEKRFSVSFSRDNVAALKNSVIAHRDAIECDYMTIEIFLRTILKRMEDIQSKKPINNPIRFFFAGAFGAMYLWNLTPQEEEAGSGYHKGMMRAVESGKSPVAGLKTM